MEPAPYLTPAPPARSSRLGRSAWLVFGGGLLLLALTVGFGFLAEPYMRHEEVATIAVIGLLSGGVFTLWSIVLAIRALWAGERQTLPILLLLFLAAVLMGGSGVAGWFKDISSSAWERSSGTSSLQYILFLPIILPFISFICLTGAPLVLWLLRRRKRAKLRNGTPELSRRERWCLALRWATVYVVICAAILIPLPLFVMSAVWDGGIRTDIASHTPDIIRDAAEALLFRLYINSYRHELHYAHILRHGRVSEQRLVDRLFGSDPNAADFALLGLIESNPKRAADLGEKNFGKNSGLDYCLGCYGTTAQRMTVIRSAQTGKLVSDNFFAGLRDAEPDAEIKAELEKYLASDVPSRSAALAAIVKWSPDPQRFKLIHDFMFNGDSKEVSVFLTRTRLFFAGREYVRFAIWDALDHPDSLLRLLAMTKLSHYDDLKSVTRSDFLRKLVALSKADNQNLAALAPVLVEMLPQEKRDKNDLLIMYSRRDSSLFPQGIPQAALDRVLERAEAELKRMDEEAWKK